MKVPELSEFCQIGRVISPSVYCCAHFSPSVSIYFLLRRTVSKGASKFLTVFFFGLIF